MANPILSTITPAEFHNNIKRLYSKSNRFINVIGVEGQDNLTEAQAKQIIETVENSSTIEPYTEDLKGKTLISGLNIIPGTITKTQNNQDVGATTFTLGNGVTVHYKFVDKQKDRVALNAISYGGTSLLGDADLPSADFVVSLLNMSGLGDFSLPDLKKVLAGKTASVSPSLGDIRESVSGNSNTKDVETMLQMVHLYFVKPRFDAESFQVLKNNLNNYLVRKSKDLGSKMNDSLTVTLYGKNNPKKRLFDQSYIDDISFDKIQEIYAQRFGNVSDFEFFIVGDTKEDELKPLLEQYIASIPTNKVSETYNDNGAQWIAKTIDKDVFIEMENPKANVNITYKKEMPYALENAIYTNVLGDILQLRVTETVREAEGGAYSPRANASFGREPKSQAYVSFNFDCNPETVDNLVNIVKGELEKIANGTINDDDLSKTKTNFIKEREQAKDKNAFDMRWLTTYFRYSENINDPKNFEDIVNNITKTDIQNIATQILDGAAYSEIVFKPKQ
ncbi:MAG: M16 family metallopeptidase [Flavobacteriaceae bacterium]